MKKNFIKLTAFLLVVAGIVASCNPPEPDPDTNTNTKPKPPINILKTFIVFFTVEKITFCFSIAAIS